MSLDRAIEHNKEHRKRYYGAKACDKTCRNHGSDDWSKDNRLHKHKRAEPIVTNFEECKDLNILKYLNELKEDEQ